MARRLEDVLHHFDPRLGAPAETTAAPAADAAATAAAARLVAVPVGPGDLLRVAAIWNLSVELARHGAPAQALLSARDAHGLDAGPGPIGSSVEVLSGEAPEVLARDAAARASRWLADAPDGLALACLPADGLERCMGRELGWALLLAAPARTALRDAERIARRLLEACPMARVGVAIHGVHSVAEAREAFEQLATGVERAVGRGLASYGLLVDDLALYRALVERRPVGLARPQSPAARALADVARLLLEDAGPAGPA